MSGKRGRILATAEEEFLLHGYDGTSIDAIVREVGGSKSTVYAHFKDKGILFAQALAQASRELDFSLSQFRLQQPATLEDGLTLLGVELLSVLYRERTMHLFRLVVAESQRFPEVARQFWEEGPGEALRQIAAYLREQSEAAPEKSKKKAPGFAAEANAHANTGADADAEARRFFALLRGDFHLRHLLGLADPPTPEEIVEMAREASRAFLSGAWELRE